MRTSGKRKRGWLRTILIWVVEAIAAFYLLSLTVLVALRWVDPPVTMVQAQRRIEAWVRRKPYTRRQQWAPLGRISPHLQHAVISAEDGRFFQHKIQKNVCRIGCNDNSFLLVFFETHHACA